MLQHLRIQNLALMEEAELAFDSGFHSVTGETGAGKSVLLGALAILSGNRVEKSIIRRGQNACVVEASLYTRGKPAESISEWLRENELPECEEDTLIISRSIYTQKAARVLVNGKMTTVSKLRELGALWIDFHGPGEPQKLMDENFQLAMVDSYGNYRIERERFAAAYKNWKTVSYEINQLREQEFLDEDALRYLEIQLNKLQSLELEEPAIQSLESDFKRMSHAQEIGEAAHACYEALAGNSGTLDALGAALRAASELSEMDVDAEPLEERLNSLYVEAEDLANEYRERIEGATFDPSEAEDLQKRMALWMDLKRKYGGDRASVLSKRDSMAQKIQDQGNVEGRLIELESQLERAYSDAEISAKALGLKRRTAASKLQTEVVKVLKTLGFKKADLKIQVSSVPRLSERGADSIEFLFSANPGSDPLPLNQIASSGEMARVMLALKTVLARYDGTPVLVFDEVDANVGGEIGKAVGDRLKALAEKHQVFCITHLPQVAAKGSFHWRVLKDQTDENTAIHIDAITDNRAERISELARMMGDRNSATALKHAEELLG
ncbi:MAG: DNA repair protein RecN [Verrucomicrobiota bacterium]